MAIPKYALTWSALQVILIFVSTANAAKISLFTKKDFTGLHLEVIPTQTCYNVPRNKVAEVNSIKTDTCFIAYSDADCKSPWTTKLEPGSYVTNKTSLGYEWLIDSLHKCNEQEGGPELNVDITTHFENKFPPVKPEILQSYTDVCTCKNIPKYVEDMSKWSIDNHGNELLAYFEPNCEEKKSEALQINAGHWINSRDMHTHIKYSRGTTLQILSFGPNPNTTYFKTSCKNAWKGNPEKKEEKSNELSAERMDEKFKAVETKIEVLESHFEHSKRKLDLCQNNVDKLQRKYAKDMKNVTGDFKILEKDNEDLNENNLKLGNIMLNVTGIVQGLQLVNLNLKSKVRTLEEKAKRAQLEQDLSMEDKFKLQMEQFQRLLNELSSKKHH